ncbi:hypothetical protein MAR_015846 [Mya arenaria]|uniref:Uncharacterized protein n=1 Tax=Mya arenaria TaxID=6604 RepID=A0ABY7FJX5_MYAAR|nr:hypothetical protein MAR_015846 [Mya arenaria]
MPDKMEIKWSSKIFSQMQE